MARKEPKRSPHHIVIDDAGPVPTIMQADFDRALVLADGMAKRIAILEATVQDLIPVAAEPWTNHAGTLFGIGGGSVLRAMAALGIPRRAKLAPRLAHKAPPLIGEFGIGDLIVIGDRICKIRSAVRRTITLKILGKVE